MNAVPGDYALILINQHRIGKSKFLDGCSDLGHLRIAVGSTVACVGDELVDRDVLDRCF